METAAGSDVVLFPAHPVQWPVDDPRERRHVLVLPYRYTWDHEGVRHRYTVPSDFVHDGASVPSIARSIIAPEPMDRVAIGHDHQYHWAGALPAGTHEVLTADGWEDALDHPDGRLSWPRKMSDRWMYRMLREDPWGPSRCERRWSYRAIRVAGWRRWGNRQPQRAAA